MQQAASTALAAWLSSQLSGVTVDTRWPSPDRELPAKAVTVILAGARQDTSIVEHLLSATNVGTTQTHARWAIKYCEQPVALDIWAKTDAERDDILAQLDVILNAGDSAAAGVYNPMPVGDGVLVHLTGEWADTYAEFQFTTADIDDTPDSVNRSEYRATIRANAYFMLAVTKLTARQILIHFKSKLDLSDANTTITPAGYSTAL